MKIIKLEKVDSTNNYCREQLHAASLPLAVIAREQFAGRGRYGKTFHSPVGGLYLSYAFEASYDLDILEKITTVAAAVVHSVLSEYSNDLYIKPVNDIYLNDRKICGILTERVDEPGKSDSYYIIVGIGINVLPSSVPEELSDIMGFLFESATAPNIIEEITDKIASALDSVFGTNSSEKFSELIDYYNLNIR